MTSTTGGSSKTATVTSRPPTQSESVMIATKIVFSFSDRKKSVTTKPYAKFAIQWRKLETENRQYLKQGYATSFASAKNSLARKPDHEGLKATQVM